MVAADATTYPIGNRALDERARRGYAALFDPETGLPTRALLYDRLFMALARTRRTGTAVAVVFVRVDGPVTGDVVAQAARVMSAEVRFDDTVARTGPGEFVMVCHLRDAQEAMVLVRRIAQVLRTHRDLREMTVGHTAGVGTEDPGEVLIRAASAAPVPLGGVLAVAPPLTPDHRRASI